MTRLLLVSSLAALGIALTVCPLSAQTAAPAPPLTVSLACERCDRTQLAGAVPFVRWTTEAALAEVTVDVTVAAANGGEKWTLAFAGRERFNGQNRTLSFISASGATADQAKADVARFLRLGLAEYAAASSAGAEFDLAYKRPGGAATSPASKDLKDPWHHWVFRLGGSTDSYGEESSSSRYYSLSASASRVTEAWRLRVNSSRSVSTSAFDLDETSTVKSRTVNWSMDGLAVKSLTPHWSAATIGSVYGSSYSNEERRMRLMAGAEYDIFPYAESSRRSLVLQYTAGVAHYRYAEATIFDKLSEQVWQHNAAVYLGLRQPWGQTGSSLTFNQQLSSPDRTRLSVNGNVSVRLFKALNLNMSGNYQRIRDLFTLPRGTATDEQVLLRQRQLATGYRYSLNFGFSYAFGALSNTTVNPRFGG